MAKSARNLAEERHGRHMASIRRAVLLALRAAARRQQAQRLEEQSATNSLQRSRKRRAMSMWLRWSRSERRLRAAGDSLVTVRRTALARAALIWWRQDSLCANGSARAAAIVMARAVQLRRRKALTAWREERGRLLLKRARDTQVLAFWKTHRLQRAFRLLRTTAARARAVNRHAAAQRVRAAAAAFTALDVHRRARAMQRRVLRQWALTAWLARTSTAMAAQRRARQCLSALAHWRRRAARERQLRKAAFHARASRSIRVAQQHFLEWARVAAAGRLGRYRLQRRVLGAWRAVVQHWRYLSDASRALSLRRHRATQGALFHTWRQWAVDVSARRCENAGFH